MSRMQRTKVAMTGTAAEVAPVLRRLPFVMLHFGHAGIDDLYQMPADTHMPHDRAVCLLL